MQQQWEEKWECMRERVLQTPRSEKECRRSSKCQRRFPYTPWCSLWCSSCALAVHGDPQGCRDQSTVAGGAHNGEGRHPRTLSKDPVESSPWSRFWQDLWHSEESRFVGRTWEIPWEIHTGATCSWKTVHHGRDSSWSNLWRTVAQNLEKLMEDCFP